MSKALPLTLRNRLALTLVGAAARLASPGVIRQALPLSGVDDRRGWHTLFSSFGQHLGFQTDTPIVADNVVREPTGFSCQTLIAGDIGTLRAKLMEQLEGIWVETVSPSFSPVLRKPNRFQTWQKFIEQWVFSLLNRGNAYILKERDARRVVVAMYVLDPSRCRPLVAQDGSVYYALNEDDLSRVFVDRTGEDAVPASEIIHDRINCIFHPLVGVSPIFAAGLAATKGLKIEENAARFFANASQPGGILTAPVEISDETAKRLKEYFELKFTGANAGKVAVLGDGLKYEQMGTNAVDAQLVEQLHWGAKQIAACYHVPGYLVGAEPVPPNNNIEALRQDYYARCLRTLIEGIENALDDGLGLGAMTGGKTLRIELDLDGLLRMDTTALTAALKEQVGAGITSPNEARQRLNLPPVAGGETPYLQEQNWPISQLSKRPTPTRPVTAPADMKGFNTKDAKNVKEIQDLIVEQVKLAMAALPKPTVDAGLAAELIGKQVDARLPSMVATDLPALVEKAVTSRLDEVALSWQAKTAALVQPGRDGLPGSPGRPGTPGENGRDGIDGFSPDDLAIELKDGRKLVISMHGNGRSIVREVNLAGLPIDKGVHKFGQFYRSGDLVTYASSYWVCKKDTTASPGCDDWRMVFRGNRK